MSLQQWIPSLYACGMCVYTDFFYFLCINVTLFGDMVKAAVVPEDCFHGLMYRECSIEIQSRTSLTESSMLDNRQLF